jgi:release factor H-coupled RctB family protein
VDPLPELDQLHHYDKLGTVGGGNHFAELQEFDTIYDAETVARYGINTDRVHLLVHSGSRNLGSQYLRYFCDNKAAAEQQTKKLHGPYPADTNSSLFAEYLRNHDVAINYAIRNRQLIARRLLEQLTGVDCTEPVCKIDIIHNFLERVEIDCLDELKVMAKEQGLFPRHIPAIVQEQQEGGDDDNNNNKKRTKTVGWIHRKGATPTTQSDVLVIPGSRGTHSYLAEINRRAEHGSAYSLTHGAGRRMTRSTALARHLAQFPNP